MSKITIDGQEYDTEQLPDQAKEQIALLRATDREIQRLNLQLTLARTARNSFAKTLQGALKQKQQ